MLFLLVVYLLLTLRWCTKVWT